MKPLPSLTRDGPPPLAVRGLLPAPFLRCPLARAVTHEGGGGGAKTSQIQETKTTDNRVATDGDGNQIYHGNAIGGSLTLNTLADDVAIAALDTAAGLGANALDTAVALNQTSANTLTDLASGALDGLNSLLDSNQRTTSEAFSLVQASAANSAAGARQVADSQKEFLRAQTGQETVVKIIGYGLATLAVGGIALAVATSKKSK